MPPAHAPTLRSYPRPAPFPPIPSNRQNAVGSHVDTTGDVPQLTLPGSPRAADPGESRIEPRAVALDPWAVEALTDGAEFRPPLLIGLFGCVALQAVIVNKAKSLVVVLVALPSRLIAVPPDAVAAHWFVAVSLLLGTCSAHGSVRLGRPRCEPRPCTGSSAC
jgi:hypothetical protein